MVRKKTCLRTLIYIKLTRSNDDDSRKHPLKYFSLKFHIWREINNLILRLEFIAQWAFYSFWFWHRCNAKFVTFFHCSLVTQFCNVPLTLMRKKCKKKIILLESYDIIKTLLKKVIAFLKYCWKSGVIYVQAGRIIRNWNAHSEKRFRLKRFSDSNCFG